ncbi:tryptophan synthase subunit alpha [Faecalibacter rhinopitheci]|uniref:Tryptophan synthase alpha chain n=1 Tax=Faecalibacter rhinopitheci TaxID=2779678 RepID=A0A8J7KI23_9FLAO|nr:tryptophan synthase subunit alpha [Faecalibacter rhinopitheci]MBF0596976.1 tryptophan synthase subunit alpha [Faecalibacter rhinopitheci]
MKTLDLLFQEKKENLITIYTTAGYPNLMDTPTVLKQLQNNNVDIIEVGIPYSDPLADGPTIQATSEKALANGMNLKTLFDQLKSIKEEMHTPIVLMGYYNQMMKFGIEKFLGECKESGVSGLILPDMPFEIYLKEHQSLFEKYNQKVVFLITPQTPKDRIKAINDATSGFVYVVSNSATTGATEANYNEDFLAGLKNLGLTKPYQIGFGISTKTDVEKAWGFADGAIIGSAFLRAIENSNDLEKSVDDFIATIK